VSYATFKQGKVEAMPPASDDLSALLIKNVKE
jgi:hypothetical protein